MTRNQLFTAIMIFLILFWGGAIILFGAVL